MPHTLGKDEHFVSYQDMYTSFTPHKKLSKGGLCADLRIRGEPHIGVIKKIAKRRRGHAVTVAYLDTDTVAVIASHHCVPLPAVNEFVRHKEDGNYYKVNHHGGEMISMFQVFESAPKTPSSTTATPTATTQTPATNRTAPASATIVTSQTPAAPNPTAQAPASATTATVQTPNAKAQAPASATTTTVQTPAPNPAAPVPATTPQPPATANPAKLLSMEPKLVVMDTKLTKTFVKYHLKVGLPDITDLPEVPHESMLYWKKRNRKDRKQPHSILEGLCAK